MRNGRTMTAACNATRSTTPRMALAVALGLIAYTTTVTAGRAETYPSRPITLVIPYPPGGNVDVSARILQRSIGDTLGQPLIVENRPGGAGLIAGNFVLRAKPDGYTLFVASNGPILLGPLITKDAPYRWQDSFIPISSISQAPTLLLVRKDFPAKTVSDFVEYARKNPEAIKVGYGGVGSINNMVSELMQQVTGVKWLGVNYRGNAPLMTDLIGDHVDAAFIQPVDALPHVESGAVRVLAVIAGKRMEKLPSVPTMAEAGYPNVTGLTFNGLYAPKGTPQQVIDKLSAVMRQALRKPEAVAAFEKLGSEAYPSTPTEFTKFMTEQTAVWSEVVKKSHIQVDN
ncbi:tripartite tricarboxylate transporter substrate binding protein [Pseudolabrys taiwanensis]|uniref:Tripartite tricarboxylate transporter substrate binding protein n=1 Tax=Pseudolabrys taiwanensis TaxID=331696 RepID=A0A346A2Q4_9HYPH|nr:tripartite tricarboxylate transporter substrate binding protein [Pseudolabrys taiwanensis]AXK83451.1 tripartite tricarboxylate transporter substrate binding protein [Pseudolabrys taiwanensis]